MKHSNVNQFDMMPQQSSSSQMSSDDFERIRARIRKECGIVLQDHKRSMVQTRLLDRLQATGKVSFADYIDSLDQPQGQAELESFCNALTTNLTSFFRESHHFDHFAKELERLKSEGVGRMRVWSAGCSTGEEAYSIAISLAQAKIKNVVADAKILATDVDTEVLGTAKAGVYNISDLPRIPQLVQRQSVNIEADKFEFNRSAKDLISFKQLNLLRGWPFRGPFDAIFCRNVMIYFSAETKAELITRFAEILRPGGVLYLGHSENILGDHPMLKNEGQTTYRKLSAT